MAFLPTLGSQEVFITLLLVYLRKLVILQAEFWEFFALTGQRAFNATDLKILAIVQEDASCSIAEIAEKVHLSINACWRRMKNLEDEGIIRKRVALLDPKLLGVGVTVFVSVRAGEHSEPWLKEFADAVRKMPEVVEFYRMSGDIDYLLKVQVADVQSYDTVYKRLIRVARMRDVSAAFAMEELKQTSALPLPGRN